MFTVMDYDVITANDFAGECYMSLNHISGVEKPNQMDNFHGLKQIELNLMWQKDKGGSEIHDYCPDQKQNMYYNLVTLSWVS